MTEEVAEVEFAVRFGFAATVGQPLAGVRYEAVGRVEHLTDPGYGRWTRAQFAAHVERTVRAACEAQLAQP